MKIKAFITHKKAERYCDCQDYFVIDTSNRAIAVSDGMSQSVFPDKWARILTEYYTNNLRFELSPDVLNDLQHQWKGHVDRYLEESSKSGKPTYRLRNSLKENRGAGATLCGIQFLEGRKWVASIIGDTSLIEISPENEIVNIYSTIQDSYNNHPDFLDSMLQGRGEIKKFEGELGGKVACLCIVSDPFAEFLFS